MSKTKGELKEARLSLRQSSGAEGSLVRASVCRCIWACVIQFEILEAFSISKDTANSYW